jgi:hypothetical protein
LLCAAVLQSPHRKAASFLQNTCKAMSRNEQGYISPCSLTASVRP